MSICAVSSIFSYAYYPIVLHIIYKILFERRYILYRNTYLEINLRNITNNVKTLIDKNSHYKYYFGVVKADCYGHGTKKTLPAIINGGVNYLAVATLEEALEVRRITSLPILCLGIIPVKFVPICINNNITITISNINYLLEIIKLYTLRQLKNLKVHIKINTGMNRLGVNNKNDFNFIYQAVKKNEIILEGIYTHIYSPMNNMLTLEQFNKFEEITSDINLNNIPIIHLCASDAVFSNLNPTYANGCRLGIAMYGLQENIKCILESTCRLYSEVTQINDVTNETVGYSGSYKTNGRERIAIVPIGYADGIIRKNTGRFVYIKNRPFKIVGNICMDMLFVKVDNTVSAGDKVIIIKDIDHIKNISKYLGTIPYEVICSISKRVPRVYI